MSRRILGKTFDIHGGGLDWSFRITRMSWPKAVAAREANGQVLDAQRFDARFRSSWQSGRTQRSSRGSASRRVEQISRSKGAGGLAQLIEKQTGERLRFFLLRTHYRSTNVFGEEPLAEAGTALDTFYRYSIATNGLVGKSFYDLPYGRTRGAFDPPRTTDPILVEALRLRDSYLAKWMMTSTPEERLAICSS